MNNKYALCTHDDPSTEIRNFNWYLDETNNVILEWEWPADRNIKFMIIVEYAETPPDIEHILEEEKSQTVVTRNLAARYQTPLPGERTRYMIFPAYFNDENIIMVYQPGYSTDWLYKKMQITAHATYKPLALSQYQQAILTVDFPDHLFHPEALFYELHENNNPLHRYPIDKKFTETPHTLYITKTQRIKFTLNENFTHALELIQ